MQEAIVVIFILIGIVGLMGLRWFADSTGFGLGEFTSTFMLLLFLVVGSVALISVFIAGLFELSRWAGLI